MVDERAVGAPTIALRETAAALTAGGGCGSGHY